MHTYIQENFLNFFIKISQYDIAGLLISKANVVVNATFVAPSDGTGLKAFELTSPSGNVVSDC
jgi:hypothetical protein